MDRNALNFLAQQALDSWLAFLFLPTELERADSGFMGDYLTTGVTDEDERKRRRESRARLYAMFPNLRPPPSVEMEEPEIFMSRRDAARLLDVDERTIYRYLRAGRLRPCIRSGKHGVRRDDVEALAHPDEVELPMPVNRRSVALLHQQVVVLRHDLGQCREALDMRWTPLELSAQELRDRHHAATMQVVHGLQRGSLDEWTNFLSRLREKDLTSIEAELNEPHPWIPFHALVSCLDKVPDAEKLKSTALSRVSIAKTNIDTLSYLWIVKRHGESNLELARSQRLEELDRS